MPVSSITINNMGKRSSHKKHAVILVAIGLWLVILLLTASWFQGRFVIPFTEIRGSDSSTPQDNSTFLVPEHTIAWYKTLSKLLPPKSSGHRLVQFWRPDCICNRFAKPHALEAMSIADTHGVEHITIVPSTFNEQLPSLQSLNPQTKLISLDVSLLPSWPNSPSVFIEDELGNIRYFGPLGFGAFCTEPSVSYMAQQLSNLENAGQPFFNVLGKGCFCHWAQ